MANAVESVSLSLCNITRTLALRNISQKWNIPIRDWKAALTRSSIQFEDQMNSL